MTADELVSRLEGVKRTGASRWIARCPAHEDRSPSLSLAERDDGAILIHCHGGCSAHEVVGALGLELHDLFPETNRDRDNRPRQRIPYRDILETLASECLVVAIAASDLARGQPLSDGDKERLWQSVLRFSNAHDLVAPQAMSQAERHRLLTREAADVVA